jgi:aspartyl-tRNA synthetase
MSTTFLSDLNLVSNADNNTFLISINDDDLLYNKDEFSEPIHIRGKVERVRKNSNKMCFVLLRDGTQSLQVLFQESDKITRDYIKNIKSQIKPESVVTITGHIKLSPEPIKTATMSNFEMHGTEIEVVSLSQVIPIQTYKPDATLDVRLNNRSLDLRTIKNQLIFKFQTQIISNMTIFLNQKGFIQIFTPRIMEGAAESGSEVFRLDYFGKPASLGQSPQLHKQMAINSGFNKVFEIGPVFRAEKSDGSRHLTQYTSIDIEMEIMNHYHEIINFLHQLLRVGFGYNKTEDVDAFDNNWVKYVPEFTKPNIPNHPIILPYKECVKLLQESEYKCQRPEDLNHQDEANLGSIIKTKYDADLFVIDRYPEEIRPFYSHKDIEENGDKVTRSYDFILCGCEILSGAQRVNNYSDLVDAAMVHLDNDVSSIDSYLETFKYGSPPHGGGAFGLERLVARYLNIDNVRNTSLFPRDPNRLNP